MQSPLLYGGVRFVDHPDPDNVMRLDQGALPMIMEMQRTGMRVNVDHLLKLSKQLDEEMEWINDDVNRMTGHPCHLGSPDQVAKLLFKDLSIPNKGIKLTDSGDREQVDSDVLEVLRDHHECIPLILEYRMRRTIQRNFCDPLPRKVNRETGRLHTRINPVRAATGRLASSEPNLQNIPIRTDLGREIRKAFVPSPGNCIGSVDASQIELRCVASIRNVKNMIAVYTDPEGDIHTQTALGVFQIDENRPDLKEFIASDEFQRKMRKPCKTINFLVVYEGSAPALRIQLIAAGADKEYWTEPKCEEAIYRWYQRYSEVREGLKRIEVNARKYEFVWDEFGRLRAAAGVKSVHKWVQSQTLREIGNHEVQGTAAGLLKLVMAEVYDEWARYWRKFGIKLLVPVHDEIVAEGPHDPLEDFLHYAGHVLKRIDKGFMKVPLDYGTAISELSWGHMK